MGSVRQYPWCEQILQQTTRQNERQGREACQEGEWSDEADDAVEGAGGHRGSQEGREAGPLRDHQAALGLPQGAQAAGSRQQAVVHPRQADGPCLWQREDQGIRHGQVSQGTPQRLTRCYSTYLGVPASTSLW